MRKESKNENSCFICGIPLSIGCECASQNKELITKKELVEMKNIEIEVVGDFSDIIESLRSETGANLEPRAEGFHITIIGPGESKILKDLENEDIVELQKINTQIKSGEGIVIKGVGFIDGSSSVYKMRDVDISKKTAFVALSIPKLQEFRNKIGLSPKDFHLTLGFDVGDIHFHVVKKEIKPGEFKEKKESIPKKADSRFDEIVEFLPEMTYKNLSGKIKEKKKKKVEIKKKEKRVQKKYNSNTLRRLLFELVNSGNSGGITTDKIDHIVDLATTNPSSLGKELRNDFRFIKPLLEKSEE